VQEKLPQVVIVELLGKATRRLVQREVRRPHRVEPAAPHLAGEEQSRQALLARAE